MNQFIFLLQQQPVFFYSLILCLGLIIGSFLNVVIYRLPIMMERAFKQEAGEYFSLDNAQSTADIPVNEPFNLAQPNSSCPHCQYPIKAYENIPLVSYLCLKGKCSQCHGHISMRYPAIELLTAILSLAVALQYGVSWQTCAALVLTWSLIALSFIDLDKMLLPDTIVLPILWLGLLCNSVMLFTDLTSAFFGAVIGYMSLWTLYWCFKLCTGKEGMGYGDFKLLALIGAWLGWQHLPLTLLFSSIVGAIVGIALMLSRGQKTDMAIPFGPYLAMAGWLAMMWGDSINQRYLSYIGL